ncbi:MAG: RnfABCDGE type electron transport complex subunit D [Candidatus Fimivivens sp.]
MKLRAQNPPHIRSRESNQTVMLDAVIAMLPLYAMATYYYGKRALALGLFSVLATTIFDMLCIVARGSVPNIRDLSPTVTGMLLPLLMPASIQFEIVAAAALFGIAVAKHPFGGVGENIFNPAVAGAAFAAVCWPKMMFLYPVPFERLPIAVDDTVKLINSPAYTLMLGGAPNTAPLDMLLGNFAGPMGATNILVLCTCFLFLAVRKTVSAWMTGAFLAGAALVAAVAPRAMLSPLHSVNYELMSGLMFIGAVFLINDPVTSPKRKLSKVLYGFLAGVVSMVFRHLGENEDSLLFAILVMNATVWIIDLWGEHFAHTLRRKNIELKTNSELSSSAEENIGADSE